MPTKLTETFVKTAPAPASGDRTIWDSEVKGFGLRIFAATSRRPDGGRSFFLNYWIDGRERRFKIGNFPEWSVTAARKEAKELRVRIDRGEDPATEKRERREAPTVTDLAERYRAEHLPRKAASSQMNDWRMIENEILPRLGSRKVAEIHSGDIEAMHRAISASGRPVRANRVLAVASKMFSLSLKPREGEERAWRVGGQVEICSIFTESKSGKWISPASSVSMSIPVPRYAQSSAE